MTPFSLRFKIDKVPQKSEILCARSDTFFDNFVFTAEYVGQSRSCIKYAHGWHDLLSLKGELNCLVLGLYFGAKERAN